MSPPGSSDLAEQAKVAPLDELPGLLAQQAKRTEQASVSRYPSVDEELGVDHILSRPPPEGAVPTAPAPVGGGPGLPPLDPQLLQQATEILTQAGLLSDPSTLMDVLLMIAEKDAPGLYDLSKPEDVAELLRAIVSGQIQLTQ